MPCYIYLITTILLFAPLSSGAVQGWAVGVIFLLSLNAAVLFLLQKQNVSRLRSTPLDKPIVALVLLALCSCVFTSYPGYYINSVALAKLFVYLGIYYLTVYMPKERLVQLILTYWIIGIATLLCIIGLLRRSGLTPFPWWNYSTSPYPSEWLSGPFVNHNHMAGWLELSLPLLLCLMLFGCQKRLFLVHVLLFIVQGISLLLTFSRGGWAGAVVSIVFIMVWFLVKQKNNRVRIILFTLSSVGIFVITLLASSDLALRVHTAIGDGFETHAFADRLFIWKGTLNMIQANWLVGIGPGMFATVFPRFQPPGFSQRYYFAHNDYLQFTAELGIFLPILIAWAIIAVYRSALQSMQHTDRLSRSMTLGSLAGITAILVHSTVDFNLHIPANALLFSVLIAFSVYNASETK